LKYFCLNRRIQELSEAKHYRRLSCSKVQNIVAEKYLSSYFIVLLIKRYLIDCMHL